MLRLTSDNQGSEAIVKAGLLDSKWHTVILKVDSDSSDLTVNVSNGGGSASMSGQIVRGLNFSSFSPQLRVGAGTVACIREGPGVRFTQSGLEVNSVAVHWIAPTETCLLPTTCSGKCFTFIAAIRDAMVFGKECPASGQSIAVANASDFFLVNCRRCIFHSHGQRSDD